MYLPPPHSDNPQKKWLLILSSGILQGSNLGINQQLLTLFDNINVILKITFILLWFINIVFSIKLVTFFKEIDTFIKRSKTTLLCNIIIFIFSLIMIYRLGVVGTSTIVYISVFVLLLMIFIIPLSFKYIKN